MREQGRACSAGQGVGSPWGRQLDPGDAKRGRCVWGVLSPGVCRYGCATLPTALRLGALSGRVGAGQDVYLVSGRSLCSGETLREPSGSRRWLDMLVRVPHASRVWLLCWCLCKPRTRVRRERLGRFDRFALAWFGVWSWRWVGCVRLGAVGRGHLWVGCGAAGPPPRVTPHAPGCAYRSVCALVLCAVCR